MYVPCTYWHIQYIYIFEYVYTPYIQCTYFNVMSTCTVYEYLSCPIWNATPAFASPPNKRLPATRTPAAYT